MVHHAFKAPGAVAHVGRGQAVLLHVDGEHGELGGGELAGVLVGGRREEDTQPGLVVDGAAGGVGPAGVDTVGQHERAGLRVQHVRRGRVHVACVNEKNMSSIERSMIHNYGRCIKESPKILYL